MTAWQILISQSTAIAGSIAWVHLNSQGGGGAQTLLAGSATTNIRNATSARSTGRASVEIVKNTGSRSSSTPSRVSIANNTKVK
tara:strand:+ start:581 stop:832 length:252 start_codon:yes stop_codon:yes gene_type:complete